MRAPPVLTGPFGEWSTNLRRLLRRRPNWSADREFDYYCVDDRVVRDHRARQEQHEREAFYSGLGTLRAMQLLDTNVIRGASVLDIGAGECFLSEAVARCGAQEVWATDAVPKQIWAAAERHAAKSNLRFLIAAADDLPFEESAFDLVLAHLVLHHIEPMESILQELFRVTRPGGRFVCVEPTQLVGVLAHAKTSENEAPVSPQRVVAALKVAGYMEVGYHFHWSRLNTSRLGALSPSYVVSARKPGQSSAPASVRLRRPLERMGLAGLELDRSCRFIDLVRQQQKEILDIIGSGKPIPD